MADDLKAAFQSFDTDGDGFLSADEVRKAAEQLGETMTDEEVTAYVEDADTDRSGQLSFAEFEQMLTARGKHA